MSDPTRSLFDQALGSIPIPEHSLEQTWRIARKLRIARIALMTFVVVLTGVGVLSIRSIVNRDQPIRPVQSPASPALEGAEDKTALVLIEDLRPELCRSYDFYFKAEISGTAYRPVQCGAEFTLVRSHGGPSPTPTPGSNDADFHVRLVSGPQIVLYSFALEEAKLSWLESHVPPLGGRIVGDRWVVDIMDRESFNTVKEALPTGRVDAEPSERWTLGAHVVEPLPVQFEPQISLRRAASIVRANNEEVLDAQLGWYTNTQHSRRQPVAAWVITLRKCVPSYGGEHALPGCHGDQLHIVVDATSGRRIASFSS